MNYNTPQERNKAKNDFIEASRALVDSKTDFILHQIMELKEENERLIEKCKKE
ncbi:MAG: hypothetical protein MJ252_07835 [archaeon]|nr:hypothetical protein [archaeon]